jgi:hypothetical protein
MAAVHFPPPTAFAIRLTLPEVFRVESNNFKNQPAAGIVVWVSGDDLFCVAIVPRLVGE